MGGHDDDDRAALGELGRHPAVGIGTLDVDLAPDRNPGDAQVLPRAAAVVTLHQHADQVTAVLLGELARGGADAALEAVADHAGPTADRALLDTATVRAVERVKDVLGLHVEAVDVVQPPVPGLGHYRPRPPRNSGVSPRV